MVFGEHCHDGREQGDPLEDDLGVLEEGDGDIVLEDSVGLNFDAGQNSLSS